MMKALLYIFIVAILLAGCSPCKHLAATQEQQHDSTLTKVITQTYYVKDTVLIEIPAQKARINPDGTLYHDLKTKQQDIPKEVEVPVQAKDSIVYRYKYKDKVQTVEVERELTWWQKTQMYGFWVALAVIVVGVIVSQRKKIISWLMKKII